MSIEQEYKEKTGWDAYCYSTGAIPYLRKFAYIQFVDWLIEQLLQYRAEVASLTRRLEAAEKYIHDDVLGIDTSSAYNKYISIIAEEGKNDTK